MALSNTVTGERRWGVAGARAAGLVLGLVLVLAACVMSLRFGSISVSTSDVLNALVSYDADSYEQTVVRSLRLPRTLIALAVGAGLAVAGAIMQAVTRNPLGDPSILGVNAGASFAIVTAVYFLGLGSPAQYVWFAFPGALIAAVTVYGIASAGRGGATPVKLALAGVVLTSLLGSWISALLLLDQQTLDVVRFWLAGSVAGRDMSVLWMVSPFLGLGLVGGLLMARQLNVMAFGEETARALGVHTGRVRIGAAALVVLMTGAAVAAAGPIAFVGLAVPHIVRGVVGGDYRWVLPYCALGGPVLLIGADTIGRLVVQPAELQAGIITALCGAPFLIVIARQRRMVSM